MAVGKEGALHRRERGENRENSEFTGAVPRCIPITIELNGCYWLGCDVVVIWEHDVRDYPDRVRGYAPWNCFVAFNCSSSSNRTCTSLFSGVWDWISI